MATHRRPGSTLIFTARAIVGMLTVLLSWAAGAEPAHAQTSISACGTLSTSGSYVLTSNLDANGNCLRVEADHVTIDLNGFVISGNGAGSGLGITDDGGVRHGIVVRDGTVRAFFGGIDLRGINNRVEGVRVHVNAERGIRAGPNAIVTGNIVSSNGDDGIDAGPGSMVSHNVANSNGTGIQAGLGSTVTHNIATGNRAVGIRCLRRCTVTHNTSANSGGSGISVFGPGSTMAHNTASNNTLAGLVIEDGSTLSYNTAQGNGTRGIAVTCPSNLIGNTAKDNATGNIQKFSTGCTVSHNSF